MITHDLELPIRFEQISGPAVDALASRKECGCSQEITESELRSNYDKTKHQVFDGLLALIR